MCNARFFQDVCAANFEMDSLRMRPLKLIYIKAWFSRLFSLSKKLACGDFSDRTRFPCAFSAAGETRRETLLRKASESTAHVAGFGFHSEGCGPPNLSEGFFDSLKSLVFQAFFI